MRKGSQREGSHKGLIKEIKIAQRQVREEKKSAVDNCLLGCGPPICDPKKAKEVTASYVAQP
jgi:hypothetical protein